MEILLTSKIERNLVETSELAKSFTTTALLADKELTIESRLNKAIVLNAPIAFKSY